jgi:hypothetical protein
MRQAYLVGVSNRVDSIHGTTAERKRRPAGLAR